MEGGIASLLLWVLSLAAAACAVVLGVILSYHWFTFGSNRAVSLIALTAYSTGCLVLIIILVAIAAAI
ncbi:hypothetical protein HY414_02245 [Candidatus Kaiserbacteria bacterium]|nr:hypothetical protein [Candidatus Kaiserbacteria bacterium]